MRTKYATCKYFNRIATGDRAPQGNPPRPAAPSPSSLDSCQLKLGVATASISFGERQYNMNAEEEGEQRVKELACYISQIICRDFCEEGGRGYGGAL